MESTGTAEFLLDAALKHSKNCPQEFKKRPEHTLGELRMQVQKLTCLYFKWTNWFHYQLFRMKSDV
jgi:hypothetical protein